MSTPTPPPAAQRSRVPTINAGANPDIANFLKIPPDATGLPPLINKNTTPAPDDPTVAQATAVAPEAVPEEKSDYEVYIESLKELKLTTDQAAEIVDALITAGFYEETFQLNKKVTVKFRTRTQDTNNRIDKALADAKPEFNSSIMNVLAKYNLASSLVQYGKFTYKPYEDDAEFNKTLKFVERLPQPVFQLLIGELSKFDNKLQVVSNSAAVISNF
jgi:hypothetical protein